MFKSSLNKMVYGGDYSPEQWDRSVWDEDVRLFKLAGIDFLRINVFTWALNQRDEETYDFTWLDEVLDFLHEQGMKVCMATGTAAHPAWMAKRYPDILRVDFEGRQRKFGGRHNSCPSSPTYRLYAERMAEQLALRYKDHPAIELWNVSNEFGGADQCYCDLCEQSFREWLKARHGTLDALNEAWNTKFWGHTFYDWDEIVVPNRLSEHHSERGTTFQGISLDYARFASDNLLECYRLEYDAVKRHIPHAVVTTNLMGAFKPVDYFKWAKHMDIVAWDNYPAIDTPYSYTAMMHDLMRGLKDGQPWLLMEQTPSQQNWQAYNALKRPGVMRLWSYQAVARGSESVLFFQMRRSQGACEKFHGAVIAHVGTEHTRVFNELAELGAELQALGDQTLGSQLRAKVGIVFDWDNWWAVEYSSGPSIALNYVNEVHSYYKALYEQNIPVDMISTDADFAQYDVVIAPVLYMVKSGVAAKIEQFVERGGTFLTTFLSGIVDERDLVTLGGYPGELRNVLGIWVEEIDALAPEHTNQIVLKQPLNSQGTPLNSQGTSGALGASGALGTSSTSGTSSSYSCNMLFELIHSEGAEVVATYGEDFYAGRPAVTVNTFGAGKAWYVATSAEHDFLRELLGEICNSKGIKPLVERAPLGVEITQRVKDGVAFLFVMNHNKESVEVELGERTTEGPLKDVLNNEDVASRLVLPPYGVSILQEKNRSKL